MNKRTIKKLAILVLFFVCMGCNNYTINVSLGETVESIRNQYLELPTGKELDLDKYDIGFDDWLFAFSSERNIVFIHTDYSDNELVVDAYAIYDVNGFGLLEYDGTTPVYRSQLSTYKKDQFFPDYIGFWGMNYDEDTYVYFLDTGGFLFYNLSENSIEIVDIPFGEKRDRGTVRDH